MGKLSEILRKFSEGQRFDDWYGELTNQISHKHLGLLAAMLITLWWIWVYDTAPYRGWVFLAVVAPYAAFEAKVQGWLSGDSWFDVAMVSFGAAMALFPFTFVRVDWPTINTDVDARWLLWLTGIWVLMLAARVLKRVAK